MGVHASLNIIEFVGGGTAFVVRAKAGNGPVMDIVLGVLMLLLDACVYVHCPLTT